MPLIFPLSAADFLDTLPVSSVQFRLDQQTQHTGLGGGEILSSEIAPPLWAGSVSMVPMTQRQAAVIEVKLAMLQVPGRKFFVYKRTQFGTAADPMGEILAGAAVTVHSENSGDQTLRLAGLPPGYSIGVGDMFSFPYGASPVRYALHRFAEGGAAAFSGLTGSLQASPPIRAGVAAGDVVSLYKPQCLAVLVPGSVDVGTTSQGKVHGMKFDFRQSLT